MNTERFQAVQGDLRPSTGKLLHRPNEVREALGIGTTTLYRLIGQGKLKVVKIGSATRITDDSLRAFAASLETEAA
ncbi:helix-turn-helix domain-containing protein [Methylobacterium mesophilicum SR1.6/6]|uniref:Helix-turn-helix domain-containing protein n=1 Tax=Methylobacterium mesophilicum SR1.6/6 TaxID=908290 RepID=A0A6B9FV26_9HYPH|nr:helix-turn-helix domain-containing protein [Methylobacterium mesophilicum]QGY04794.1 helix-turn-helix domain-containing protein [Methylobacterium mesophilicum SR1.6/6]